MPNDLNTLRNLIPRTGTLTPATFQTAIDNLPEAQRSLMIRLARGHAARIAQLDGTAGISRDDIDAFAALSGPANQLTAADIPPLLAIPVPGSTPPSAPVVAPGAPITPPGAPVANNQNLRYIFQQLLTANGNPANGLTRAQILRFINDNHSQISDTTVRGNIDTLRDSIPANSPVLLALRLIANNETGYLFRAPGDSFANDFTIADIAVVLPQTAAPNTPITAEHIINHFMSNLVPAVVDFLNRAASQNERTSTTIPVATPGGGERPYSIVTQYRTAPGAQLQTMTHTHNNSRYIFSLTNDGFFDVAIIRPNNSSIGSPISIEIYRYNFEQLRGYLSRNHSVVLTLGRPNSNGESLTYLPDLGVGGRAGIINDNTTDTLRSGGITIGTYYDLVMPGPNPGHTPLSGHLGQNAFFPLFIQHLTTNGIPTPTASHRTLTVSRFTTTNFRGIYAEPEQEGVTRVQTNHGFTRH